MSSKEEEAAAGAACLRCGVKLAESPSLPGVMMINYLVVAIDARTRGFLCGLCSLDFREFLFPWLLGEPVYVEHSTALRREWS